jgi:hypothetical protein
MANKLIEKVKAKAQELYKIRFDITKVKADYDLILKPLEARRDTIQEELIDLYNQVGITSIKTDEGETYTKSMRNGLLIKDERKAVDWAIQNRCVSINKIMAAQIIFKQEEIPSGFDVVKNEYISVRKPKVEKEGAEEAKEE